MLSIGVHAIMHSATHTRKARIMFACAPIPDIRFLYVLVFAILRPDHCKVRPTLKHKRGAKTHELLY